MHDNESLEFGVQAILIQTIFLDCDEPVHCKSGNIGYSFGNILYSLPGNNFVLAEADTNKLCDTNVVRQCLQDLFPQLRHFCAVLMLKLNYMMTRVVGFLVMPICKD